MAPFDIGVQIIPVMHEMNSQYWFKSDLFEVDPKEDEETNPFCYGKELAKWLREKFSTADNELEKIIPEDWGWCVMLQRKPYMLWLGCGNVGKGELYDTIKPEVKDQFAPKGEDLIWTCFVGTDFPFWSGYFWKRIFGNKSLEEKDIEGVSKQLENILKNDSHITLVEEP